MIAEIYRRHFLALTKWLKMKLNLLKNKSKISPDTIGVEQVYYIFRICAVGK
jgi:hypothetical protein